MSSDMAGKFHIEQWHVTACSLLLTIASLSHADDLNPATADSPIEFTVSPLTCVALHKKQVCYKTLEFQWSSLPNGRYCLYASDQSEALRCWNNSELDNVNVEYASATKVVYELRRDVNKDNEGEYDLLASVVVKTSWVYRTGRRSSSGWRLF